MQQQQQSPQMFPTMAPSLPPSNITTEQIQKYLDENKKLIMAIMENQNLGKLAECAQYQALLQKNLMYLAAIADAQPPPPPTTGAAPAPAPAMASQMGTPHPSQMQPPSYFMQQQQQHPQASGMALQASPAAAGIFPPRGGPLQFGSPHQQQQLQLHQQQVMQGHMGIRPTMGINGMQHQPETSLGGSGANVSLRGGGQQGGADDGK